MSNSFSSKFAACIAWAAFALLIASIAMAFVPTAIAQEDASDRQTPADLLEDGMDAAADQAPESARRLLGQLIEDYPGSPEALRARKALAALDKDAAAEQSDVMRADEAERTAKYRRAFLIDAGDRVFFSEGSAAIGGRARSMIENQARWLKARPDLTVTVIGRADDGGTRGSALALSRQRAEAVRDMLVAAGIDAGRIALKAAGDRDPLALCKTQICQAQNRNSEVLINEWRGESAGQAGPRSSLPPVPRTSMGVGQSKSVDQVPE
jgi:peptidoglycan-associated lipoprotein